MSNTYDSDGAIAETTTRWLVDDIIYLDCTIYVGKYFERVVHYTIDADTYELLDRTFTYRYYYFVGSQRIATYTYTDAGEQYWLLSDHLGSTSVTADVDGDLYSETRYSAFGEVRYSLNNTPTDYMYTGQRNVAEIGLYYYVARFYDPQTAHFLSADTVVPRPGSALSYDRYAYVECNPIVFNDPSGHWGLRPDLDGGRIKKSNSPAFSNNIYGIVFTGDFSVQEKTYVIMAVSKVAYNLSKYSDGLSPSESYKLVYGISEAKPQIFQKGKCEECQGAGGYHHSPLHIEFHYQNGFFTETASMGGHRTQHTADQLNIHTVIHELGHGFRARIGSELVDPLLFENNLVHLNVGYAEFMYEDQYWESNNWDETPTETFANQFLGWNYDTWADDSWGENRQNFMNQYMPVWIAEQTGRDG